MSLPFFYAPGLTGPGSDMILDEATSRHCVQVLRMRQGDRLVLTDGQGHRAVARLATADKRGSTVVLDAPSFHPRQGPLVHIGISPLKNSSRFEWFLEKVTEIGIAGIIVLDCERTERTSLRVARTTHILVSAMLQSQQAWLPVLTEPRSLDAVLDDPAVPTAGRFIAHCLEGTKGLPEPVEDSWLLIGPEGDFTQGEVNKALDRGWIPVTLGDTRLRTETAGIVAAVLLRLGYR
jgi:16S rRNA (uracil1498-N3)-methyltransferase